MIRTKLVSEFLGTATLLATVVGSGAMATNLSSDVGIQLLINTIATVFVLYILVTLFAPISGAHFNPVVSAVSAIAKEISPKIFFLYSAAQIAGAAYFFTSSTSFANPAAVFGRMLTDTFSGIAPRSAPLFVLAEIIGALLGYFAFQTLTTKSKKRK